MAAWRFILGDLLGRPIANLTPIAKDVGLGFRLLRPDALTLRVPSDHADVGGLHTDGHPKVDSLRRTLRAYRRERQSDGSYEWTIRFAGVVWNLQDVGDEASAWTTISAYSPMQRLSARYTGLDTADRVGDGGALAKALVDATNALGPTGIATSGYGNVFETTPTRSVRYERKEIGAALIELAGAYNGFDFDFVPIHQPAGTENGTLVAMHVYGRKGANRENAVFAYAKSPHNVARIERLIDPSIVANAISGFGGALAGADGISSSAGSATSLADFGRYEAIEVESDVVTQSFLDALMAEEAVLRARPRDMVKISPATSETTADGTRRGRVPEPWRDFEIGDTVQVWAGEKLRGGFVALQRVYGFGLTVDDLGVERLDQIAASPEEA